MGSYGKWSSLGCVRANASDLPVKVRMIAAGSSIVVDTVERIVRSVGPARWRGP